MLLMLPGYRRAALLMAASAATTLPVFAQTAAAPTPSASAAVATDSAPSERAKRDAEKVFHWIMIQGDRTRKTSPATASAKDTKEEKPAAPKAIAARGSNAPVRAAADPAAEVVPHPNPETVAAVSAPTAMPPVTPPAKPEEPAATKPVRSEAAGASPAVSAPAIEPPSDDSPVALVVIAQPEPQFPVATMRTLRRGSVQVRFRVQTDGSVADLEVLQTSSPRLNAAALAAIAQWRFQPVARAQTGAVEVGFDLN